MKHFKLVVIGLAAAASAGLCHAQYRCGHVFQDRPCDGASVRPAAAPARPAAGNTTAAQPSANAPASAADSPFASTCARWGKAALDVAWRRETGVLRETQFASPASGLSRAEYTSVVDAVYARRGTAIELRAAAEAECVQQKQREADAMAAMAAVARAQGNAGMPAGAVAGADSSASVNNRAATSASAGNAAASSANNSGQCASIKEQLANLVSEARRGGPAGTMERINSERRALESQQSKLKC
jgi:hypothetical protein